MKTYSIQDRHHQQYTTRAYFTSRLLQQTSADGEGRSRSVSKDELMELLYLNLRHESQLAAACYLPSYCWLTCATLHYLHYTDDKAPIRTLTGIYTSFLRLNFGGEVLNAGSAAGGVGSGPSSEQQKSLMLYVVQTVGKLAFDGVTKKRASFSEEDLEKGMGGGETKTDEELQKLAMFRTDVMDFFLVPCVESKRLYDSVESDDKHYVFAVPAMQEYLAALYVVLGENKTALEKLTKQVSATLGQAGEDVTTLFSILSKFIPFKIFAVFNLLKLFPSLVERISRNSKGHIARTMAAEMFRSEDCFNEDVLDQVEQSLLGVHGPHPEEHLDERAFELYPIFMGGLLHYGNRRLLEQLGCTIKSETVSQITKSLKKQLVRAGRNKLPPEETMDLLTLLYEFQNPRVTAEVMQSVRAVDLSTVRMTPLKCFVLSWVLNCCPQGFLLDELNLSSCSLNQELLHLLWPAFRHARNLTLCDNDLLDEGVRALMDSLPENQSLEHLSLMHVGLGDAVALELAEQLANITGLLELNVAYNNIGDSTAVALVNACREHPTIHTVHLYLNQLTEAGKQSLYELQQGGSGRRVRALASVMEGSDVSEDWRPILSIIAKNSISWERERVREQLQVFLRELEWGRLQQRSLWKRLHLRRVESGVKHTLLMLDKASAIGSPPKNNKPSLGKLWPTS
ncbi:NLR family member X1 [Engraulis encrasicolus]|uniref:NLR family member X1 n=1 Tax=Engraulis encrasicolus TaxID=184585 RepID=UPI002FCF7350